MSIGLLTKGMIPREVTITNNIGEIGEISVDILYDEYNIIIED